MTAHIFFPKPQTLNPASPYPQTKHWVASVAKDPRATLQERAESNSMSTLSCLEALQTCVQLHASEGTGEHANLDAARTSQPVCIELSRRHLGFLLMMGNDMPMSSFLHINGVNSPYSNIEFGGRNLEGSHMSRWSVLAHITRIVHMFWKESFRI